MKKTIPACLVLLLAFSAGTPVRAAQKNNIVQIERVVNAMSLVMAGGQGLRVLGIKTPTPFPSEANNELAERYGFTEEELEEWGRQAKEFVKYLVETKQVRAEVDPNLEVLNYRDPESRIFTYVWFSAPIFAEPPDWLVMDPEPDMIEYDAFLNACILRAGYGVLETRWKFAFGEKFLALEEEARRAGRGMWADWDKKGGKK